MKYKAQWGIGILSAFLMVLIGGFATTFGLIVGSGILGYVLFGKTIQPNEKNIEEDFHWDRRRSLFTGAILVLLVGLFLWGGQGLQAPIEVQLLTTFAGVSLTLFGGGYVVIPALHELFVDQLQWLDATEFADGIAIGQVTPGPIFITAAFIGYKVAGILGALLATVGMFTPPALLTLLLSRFIEPLKHSETWKAVLKGIRPAVIGMIFVSSFTIGRTIDLTFGAISLFAVACVISYRYTKVSPIYLILGSGAVGLLFF